MPSASTVACDETLFLEASEGHSLAGPEPDPKTPAPDFSEGFFPGAEWEAGDEGFDDGVLSETRKCERHKTTPTPGTGALLLAQAEEAKREDFLSGGVVVSLWAEAPQVLDPSGEVGSQLAMEGEEGLRGGAQGAGAATSFGPRSNLGVLAALFASTLTSANTASAAGAFFSQQSRTLPLQGQQRLNKGQRGEERGAGAQQPPDRQLKARELLLAELSPFRVNMLNLQEECEGFELLNKDRCSTRRWIQARKKKRHRETTFFNHD